MRYLAKLLLSSLAFALFYVLTLWLIDRFEIKNSLENIYIVLIALCITLLSLKMVNRNKIEIKYSPNEMKDFIGRQKELFIHLSHELKTPLAVMKSSNQIEQRKSICCNSLLNENLKYIDRFDYVVKAILETGREQFNFFENIESFDLIEHIESFKNQFLILAKKDKKDINFDFQIKKVNLSTKKNLIKNILTHLVKNAIDFSTKDETIEFVVKIVNRKVVISISNSGELPKNLKVFEPFTRGVTTKGLGLGLFLASSEAKLINASLNIEAKDGIVTSTLTL